MVKNGDESAPLFASLPVVATCHVDALASADERTRTRAVTHMRVIAAHAN
jgi:hypothetical protein